jgi:hypothetical protein
MNAALLITAFMAAIVALTGCAGEPDAPDAPRYEFSHTIDGVGECAVVRVNDESTDEVRLLCDGSKDFTDSCPGGAPMRVYAVPGAGDGTAFGVGSLIDLDTSGCSEARQSEGAVAP